jgi:hypothetical protein
VSDGTQDKSPPQENIALRDSASIALASYWSHYYDGWSLVLFRDPAGVVRHVACGLTDGTFFDAGGNCTLEQIAQRLRVELTADSCDEAEVQALMGSNSAVLEAADELRQRIERKTQ